ncbi:DUF968 domain-containing protein [Cedecea sp. P7760]|uniref:DUF968 domain-containing protein n=1 Tax=Cedecea sp. P7760 TaxID=2726983 RepID=UPI0015A03F8F|nr:DUF968 domain-containing protein [Cedecea sp. P7760]NWC66025.1 DUF968 domain-containing protein [Cedecea sp. P7760]
MRAILTVEIAHNMGVVLLKPGRELMQLFGYGRVLIEMPPKAMAHLPLGKIPDARQPLVEDIVLDTFFSDERVIQAAGGMTSLESWLFRSVHHCQWPHTDYHHNEKVTMRHSPGAMLLCWSCDNKLRDQSTEQLEAIALQNVKAWVIDAVLSKLGFNSDRELSLAELCWWAVYTGVSEAIGETMARRALNFKPDPILSVYRETDLEPSVQATSELAKRTAYFQQQKEQEQVRGKPVVVLVVDPESPQTFFSRPKRIRWENPGYLKWVKTQPCEGCGSSADDPHHLIGHGQGGMGTKSHDSFAIPLCRKCHDELHRDQREFERKHGSQLVMLKNTLDRAFALGVLA